MMVSKTFNIKKHESIEVINLEELRLDWNTPFINSIYVVGQTEKCDGDDQPVISLVWPGAQHLCKSKEGKYFNNGDCSHQKVNEVCYTCNGTDSEGGYVYEPCNCMYFNNGVCSHCMYEATDIAGFPMI